MLKNLAVFLIFMAGTIARAAAPVEAPHVAMPKPPLVQMLGPGFTAPELPVALRNISNLVHARLVARRRVHVRRVARRNGWLPVEITPSHERSRTRVAIGPDLSNLVHRDYASVLRHIVQPSATINPDRIAYLIMLKDGTSANGMVLDDTPQTIGLGDVAGQKRTLEKNTIATMKASPVSLMPEGLWQNLTSQPQRDVMTFPLTEPPIKK